MARHRAWRPECHRIWLGEQKPRGGKIRKFLADDGAKGRVGIYKDDIQALVSEDLTGFRYDRSLLYVNAGVPHC